MLHHVSAIGLSLLLFSSGGTEPMQEPVYPPYSVERVGSTKYKSCIVQDTSNVGQGRCLEQEYKRTDAKMILVSGIISRSFKGPQRQQFLNAQIAWQTFRQQNCDLRAMGGGSGAALFRLSCLVRMTNERLAELEEAWDY